MIFTAFVLVYVLEAVMLRHAIRRQQPGLGFLYRTLFGMAIASSTLWGIAHYIQLDPTLTMVVGPVAVLNWIAIPAVGVMFGFVTSSHLP